MVGAANIDTSLDIVVQKALQEFGYPTETTFTLVNVSENSTYQVIDPRTGQLVALRISRPNYHSVIEIESELLWMDTLRDDGVVNPPLAIPALDGNRVKSIEVGDGTQRSVTLFEWLPGNAPSVEGDLEPNFQLLGSLAAKMHLHGLSWNRPKSFARYTCDYDTALGSKAIWGRWQNGLGLGSAETELLTKADMEIKRHLNEYGMASTRFGLMHNDLRLANLLVDADDLHVIDFDDCGFSWFMYDFATAVSFIEDDPRVADLMNSWIAGYTEQRALSQEDREIIPTLVMFRRLLLLGWVGSHHEYAQEAQELGVLYTDNSCLLAEKYLSGSFLR